MQIQTLLSIVETSAAFLELQVDSNRLYEVFGRLSVRDDLDFNEMLNYLNEIGREGKLVFLEAESSPGEIMQMLEVDTLTFVIPLMLEDKRAFLVVGPRGRSKIKCVRVDIEGNSVEVELHADTILHLARDAQPGQRLTVFTAWPMDPIVSYDRLSGEGDSYTPMRRLLYMLAAEKRDIGYIYVYAIAIGLLSLSLPLGIQAIIGLISGGLILQPVYVLVGGVIVGHSLAGILQIQQIKVVERIQRRVFAKAAFEYAYRIPRVRLEALSGQYAPELMNRFFDILTIQKGFAKILTELIVAVLTLAFGLLLLAFYHPFFIIFSVILLTVLVVIFVITGPRGLRTSLMESKYKYKVAHWLEELARNLPTFKLSGFTRLPLQRMDYYTKGYIKKRDAHFRVLISQYFSIIIFKVVIIGGMLALGAYLVIERQITLGQFVASEIVIISVLAAVEKLILNLDVIYDVLTASEKLGNVTDLPLDRNRGMILNPHTQGSHAFDIQLRNIHYTHPGASKPTLRDITLDIPPSYRVGLVGPPGSGKTTLLYLIGGLLQNYKGIVAYNGVSQHDINLNSLRDYIGENLRYEDIFVGSVEDNLSVGKDHTLDELYEALKLVGLGDWIRQQPEGLRTELAAHGEGLNTDVLMRLILARTIVEHPRLVVFDQQMLYPEPSYLETVHRIFLNERRDWTFVCVTNDPDILRACDLVAYLEEGQVVAQGTFKSLLNQPNFRRQLVFSQQPLK
jgi:ABC-type bacteriocin/lantibiotic exporter with double-glycine peptidase domain